MRATEQTACRADDCEKPARVRGLCQTHYCRWRRHGHWQDTLTANANRPHDPSVVQRHYVRGTPEQRWAAKYVEHDSGCWLWLGRLNANGYGVFGGGGSVQYAHRFGYELHVGPIPEGLELDHLCRTRNCVRPSHLEAVTRQINQHRGNGPTGLNSRKTHCIRGHAFTPDNLVAGQPGRRMCKTCHRDRQRAYYQQKVASA